MPIDRRDMTYVYQQGSCKGWIVDMHELTQYPYTIQWFNFTSSNVWQGFETEGSAGVHTYCQAIFCSDNFVLPSGYASGHTAYKKILQNNFYVVSYVP